MLLLLLLALSASQVTYGAWTIEQAASHVGLVERGVIPAFDMAFRRIVTNTPLGPLVVDITVVAYEDGATGKIRLARKYGLSAWTVQNIENGRKPSVAIDAAGVAHIAYHRGPLPDLYYPAAYARQVPYGAGNCGDQLQFQCEQWCCGTYGNVNNISPTDILIDSAGVIHARSLSQYWYYSGGAWQLDGTTGITGGAAVMLLDSIRRPFIFDRDNGLTRWHIRDPGYPFLWQIQPPDAAIAGAVKQKAALQSDDLPHLCATSDAFTGLLHVRRLTTTWTMETIFSGPAGDCSIQMRPGNLPSVSFRDKQAFGLIYAEKVLNFWIFDFVDYTADVGYGSVLRLNNLSKPIIAYYDKTNSRILIARKQ